MKHSTSQLTKPDLARFEKLRAFGCIACFIEGLIFVRCGTVEVHHTLSGNKRRGHEFTMPLGQWHHRGEPLPDYTKAQMREQFGPSLAEGSKPFHERYGSDEEIMARIDLLIGMT